MVTPWLLAVLLGSVVGLLLGPLAERVPVAGIVQSMISAYVCSVFASLVAMLLLLHYVSRRRGVGAFGFGVSPDGLLAAGVMLALVAILHAVSGRLQGWFPRLIAHRPIVFGVVGGLYGALPFAWAFSALSS